MWYHLPVESVLLCVCSIFNAKPITSEHHSSSTKHQLKLRYMKKRDGHWKKKKEKKTTLTQRITLDKVKKKDRQCQEDIGHILFIEDLSAYIETLWFRSGELKEVEYINVFENFFFFLKKNAHSEHVFWCFFFYYSLFNLLVFLVHFRYHEIGKYSLKRDVIVENVRHTKYIPQMKKQIYGKIVYNL